MTTIDSIIKLMQSLFQTHSVSYKILQLSPKQITKRRNLYNLQTYYNLEKTYRTSKDDDILAIIGNKLGYDDLALFSSKWNYCATQLIAHYSALDILFAPITLVEASQIYLLDSALSRKRFVVRLYNIKEVPSSS